MTGSGDKTNMTNRVQKSILWVNLGVAVTVLVAAMLGLAVAFEPHVAAGMAVGALAGIALGWFGLKHTRFDAREGRRGYTPNPWIGGALSLLLVARLAWRWQDGAFSQGMAPGASNASPLTLGLAAALVCYGLTHAIGLLLRMRYKP